MSKGILFVLIACLVISSALLIGFLVPIHSEFKEVVVIKSWHGQEVFERKYETMYDNHTLTFVWKDWRTYRSGDRLRLKYTVYLFRKSLDDVRLRLSREQRIGLVTREVFRYGGIVEINYEDSLNETLSVHFEIRRFNDTILWQFTRYDSKFSITWELPSRYESCYYVLQFKLKYEPETLEQRAILHREF